MYSRFIRFVYFLEIIREKAYNLYICYMVFTNTRKKYNKGGGRCCLCKPGRGRWGTKCYDGNPEDCCKNTRKYKERNRERNRKNKTWFNKLFNKLM